MFPEISIEDIKGEEGTLIRVCSLLNYNLPLDELRLSLPSYCTLEVTDSFYDEDVYDLILCGADSVEFLRNKFFNAGIARKVKPYTVVIGYENEGDSVEYLLNKTIDEIFSLPATKNELVLYLNDLLKDKFDEDSFQ